MAPLFWNINHPDNKLIPALIAFCMALKTWLCHRAYITEFGDSCTDVSNFFSNLVAVYVFIWDVFIAQGHNTKIGNHIN